MMKDELEKVAPEEGDDKRHGVALNDRSLAAWEIASVVSSFLIAEWMVLPFAANSKLVMSIPVGLAFALMLFSHRVRRESAREVGWRLDTFGRSVRLLLLPMLAAAVIILAVGYFEKSLRFDRSQVLEWAWSLPLWALFQQYVLQGFINRRAQILYGRGLRSVLLVALLFALLHLPNPWLSVATFAGGAVWADAYQRAPNLPALTLSHALMSILLALSLPATTINSLRVGIKYFG